MSNITNSTGLVQVGDTIIGPGGPLPSRYPGQPVPVSVVPSYPPQPGRPSLVSVTVNVTTVNGAVQVISSGATNGITSVYAATYGAAPLQFQIDGSTGYFIISWFSAPVTSSAVLGGYPVTQMASLCDYLVLAKNISAYGGATVTCSGTPTFNASRGPGFFACPGSMSVSISGVTAAGTWLPCPYSTSSQCSSLPPSSSIGGPIWQQQYP